MVEMEPYPLEYTKHLEICYNEFDRNNLRFNCRESFWQRNWRFIYLAPLVIIHWVTEFIYLVHVLYSGGDIFADAQMIPVVVVMGEALIRFVIVIMQKGNVESIIDRLAKVWRTDDLTEKQKLIKENELKELRLAGLFVVRGPITVAYYYALFPLVQGLFQKYILNQEVVFQLPFSGFYPVEPTQNWYTYVAIYMFQIYGTIKMSSMFLAVDFLMHSLSAFAAIEFMLLKEELYNLEPPKQNDSESDSNVTGSGQTIEKIVKRHQTIIEISQDLDDIFNKITFIHFLITTFVITFFGLAIKIVNKLSDRLINIMSVSSLLAVLFTSCYYGEKLRTASLDIADAAYTNKWYKGDTRYRKIICFIIFRSQKPCCLTSLKFVPVTLNAFTTIMSSAWSYFSLINTVYEDKQ